MNNTEDEQNRGKQSKPHGIEIFLKKKGSHKEHANICYDFPIVMPHLLEVLGLELLEEMRDYQKLRDNAMH